MNSLPYYEQLTPSEGVLMFAIVIASFLIVLHWDRIKKVINLKF